MVTSFTRSNITAGGLCVKSRFEAAFHVSSNGLPEALQTGFAGFSRLRQSVWSAVTFSHLVFKGGAVCLDLRNQVGDCCQILIDRALQLVLLVVVGVENLRQAPDAYSRLGALEFWSSGGLLHEIEPGGRQGAFEMLSIKPKHIRVITLVEGRAAVAHYYSEGTMKPAGSPAVSHYLTRVTQVFVNEDGAWKVRSSHWSPVTGGSGTSQAAEQTND